MGAQEVQIPRIEDEIENAWQAHISQHPRRSDAMSRAVFEAGFRAARTFVQTGASAHVR